MLLLLLLLLVAHIRKKAIGPVGMEGKKNCVSFLFFCLFVHQHLENKPLAGEVKEEEEEKANDDTFFIFS